MSVRTQEDDSTTSAEEVAALVEKLLVAKAPMLAEYLSFGAPYLVVACSKKHLTGFMRHFPHACMYIESAALPCTRVWLSKARHVTQMSVCILQPSQLVVCQVESFSKPASKSAALLYPCTSLQPSSLRSLRRRRRRGWAADGAAAAGGRPRAGSGAPAGLGAVAGARRGLGRGEALLPHPGRGAACVRGLMHILNTAVAASSSDMYRVSLQIMWCRSGTALTPMRVLCMYRTVCCSEHYHLGVSILMRYMLPVAVRLYRQSMKPTERLGSAVRISQIDT